MALLTPPQPDEFEVTVIGPNVGECIVLHYQGDWIIIDSCKDRASTLPAAQKYLTDLAIQSTDVKIIACSHWHDDHFKGISQLCATYPTAKFWMSGALQKKEFVELIEAYRDWPTDSAPHTSGLKELTSCLDLLRAKNVSPNFAHHDQRMWQNTTGSAELWALSPSSEMVLKGFTDIAQLAPWSIKRSTAVKSPNHIAVAMHFRAGEHSVLLGSDLEEENDPKTGWSAILSSTGRPSHLPALYKVAHHGSETGEHPDIWKRLLSTGPTSLITPFSRSALPRDQDIQRIKAVSQAVYISSRKQPLEIKRTGAVAKMIVGNNVKVIDGFPGAIQCRIAANDKNAEWKVTLDGYAERA